MYILGINGGFRPGYQDVSAVLLKDGVVLAAVEEERLSRIKYSPGRLPYLSIHEVLKTADITIRDIDLVAFHGSTWGIDIEEKLQAYFSNHFGHCPKIIRYHHHDCHAMSSYVMSGFETALSFTMDNSGDGISLQVSKITPDAIETIYRSTRPHSLGIFYSMITQYAGFTRDGDEYKLMGLSSYGNRHKYDFSFLLNVSEGQLRINEKYIQPLLPNQPGSHRDEMLYSRSFTKKMGRDRRVDDSDAATDIYFKNIAASAQQHFEHCLMALVEYYVIQTGIRKVCLAGGAALNCVANQKIMNLSCVDAIFIQPASSDAGVSLGAAWLASAEHNIKPVANRNTYLGRAYDNEDIRQMLENCKVSYAFVEHPEIEAAKMIAEGQVIGWFQGAMEFGPRALGNRSILANPCNASSKDIVNQKIKFRESFRPFCPSVLEEDVELYFSGKSKQSPYMTITYDAKDFALQSIPAVIHVDHTARIQTVSESDNPLFYSLLRELKRINRHGVVLNTSFNRSHEPIVCSPRDALATFYSSGLDALFLGNYMILKKYPAAIGNIPY